MNRRFFLQIILFLLMLSPAFQARAQQLSKFSGDSTRFIGELNLLFSNLSEGESKIVSQEMVVFVQNWNAEKFDPSKKKVIYSLANQMLKKKLRPFPDIYQYIRALDAFLATGRPDPLFYGWSEMLTRLADSKNSRNMVTFIGETCRLFEANLLYESGSTAWKATQRDFTFTFDTVPVILVPQTDLICYSGRDSMILYQTRGRYYPLSSKWIGTGGKVDWKRTGIGEGQVFAMLSDYEIQMRYSKYTADSAMLHNRKYFPSPLQGRLTDKVQADVDEESASYPRFISYEDYLGITNIFRDIDYFGGFSMEGARVLGFGTEDRDAVLTFRKDGKDFVTARSRSFVIRPDRINSGSASVSIYHEDDSIYHTGLQMKYIDELKELSMNKDERTTVLSPWFDSWHDIEIYCEALYWSLPSKVISFEVMRGPGSEGNATFESDQYYSLERYERLRGIDEFNPLNVIKNFTDRRKNREFTLDEFVRFVEKPTDQVEGLLLSLSARGFLIYDTDSKTAVVKDKLVHYVNSKNDKADYDIIVISSSVSDKSNALLNLENFDLKILGVERILLSDSQQVFVYPRAGEIVMQKGRSFSFTGKVEAGLFDFYAKNCSFEYGAFKLNMPFIDTMEFYTRGRKKDPKTGMYPLVKVNSQLNNLNGELLIDAPDNKSGRHVLPEYPVFLNKDTALIHWDRPYVFNGVYDKERFFFTVMPFRLQSMDRMIPDSLKFAGQLTSAGIFPDIAEPVRIRPDYSLGFETMTPASGYPVYGGKGTFFSKVDLSNQGLKGSGTLNYLNSVSGSDEFLFFPDSMKTVAKKFSAEEQLAAVEYPAIEGDSVVEYWLPYKDSMAVKTIRKDLVMYKGQSTYSGVLSVTPGGVKGTGTIRILDAEMDSKGFNFKQHSFDALIANFRIKSYDLASLTISTKNYRTHFDFEQRSGEFKSNLGISKIEFPFNQYICSMDRFDWMIDNEEITLMNEESMARTQEEQSLSDLIARGYVGSEFISVRPDQDSLRFFALKARYNLKSNVINADDVRIIKVADAAIFPDSGKVRILKDARMETLRNAVIIANTKTQYHHFYNAEVAVTSRHNYDAKAHYDYVDVTGQPSQIWFSHIGVDSSEATYAKGLIKDSVQFRIEPNIGFEGDVRLAAADRFLTFDGGYRPIAECYPLMPQYVRFSSQVNPSKVKLPVESNPKNMIRERLTAGFLMSNTQSRLYPLFFEKRTSFSDTLMMQASGFMEYDRNAGEFRITPADSVPGSTLTLNTENCVLSGTGPVNMGMSPGKMKMESWGTLNHYILPDSTSARVAIALTFPFSDEALEKFRQQISSTNLPGLLLLKTPYGLALNQLINPRELKNLRTELEQFGKYRKFPEELQRTIFLADVAMSWDTVTRSWLSYGPIGIGGLGAQLTPVYVEGIVEFAKKRNGDDFTIYLKLSEKDWYFFNYRNNIFQTISSNLDYNDRIVQAQQNAAEQKRVDREAKGFRYTISTERKKRDFLRKFESTE